jgi:CRP-like cAMP-binding protein
VVDAAVMSEWVVNIGRRSAAVRLAHLCCEMAFRYRLGEMVEHFVFTFPATQHHLADSLGLTSVHVNRMIRVLESSGLMKVRRGMIEILDWDDLSEFAEFDPTYLVFEDSPRTPMRASLPALQN